MDFLSPYLLAGLTAWISAQGIKYLISSVRQRSMRSWRQLYFSGNMPSAHSTTVVAILVVIGVLDGVQSGLFALAFIFSTVVMYDAMMVRRSSGEQGVALTALLEEKKSKVPRPRVAMGHTPLEVSVGAALGLCIGLLFAAI